jgi:hypothetical protein
VNYANCGAIPCIDEQVCWVLFNLTQEQIDECVEIKHDKESGLRLITIDSRGQGLVEAG